MIARSGAIRTDHGVAYDGLTFAGACRVGSGILMSLAVACHNCIRFEVLAYDGSASSTTAWAPILAGPATITLVASQAPPISMS